MATKASIARIESATAAAPESLFSRVIVGPVIFISFLISLLLVDRKIYASIFGPDHHDDHGYYHSHQRKLAKSEMDQAFQQRNRVIAGMCMASGVVVAVAMWAISAGWIYFGGRRAIV